MIDVTGQNITGSYNKMLEIQDVFIKDTCTVFRFIDEKGKEYIHYQLSPETIQNGKSKAKAYFNQIAKYARANNLNIHGYDLYYDALTLNISNPKSAIEIIGLVVPCHVVERNEKYRDVDQILFSLDTYEKDLILFQKRKSENAFERLQRITEIHKAETERREKESKKEMKRPRYNNISHLFKKL